MDDPKGLADLVRQVLADRATDLHPELTVEATPDGAVVGGPDDRAARQVAAVLRDFDVERDGAEVLVRGKE